MSDNKKLTELQQLRKDIASDTIKAIQASEQKLKKDIADDTKKAIETSEKNLRQDVGVLEKNLRKTISDSQTDTIKIVGGMINESQRQTLIKVQGMISDSQKDTVEVLMDAIHTGYTLHDKRIRRLEEELDLSPLKQ